MDLADLQELQEELVLSILEFIEPLSWSYCDQEENNEFNILKMVYGKRYNTNWGSEPRKYFCFPDTITPEECETVQPMVLNIVAHHNHVVMKKPFDLTMDIRIHCSNTVYIVQNGAAYTLREKLNVNPHGLNVDRLSIRIITDNHEHYDIWKRTEKHVDRELSILMRTRWTWEIYLDNYLQLQNLLQKFATFDKSLNYYRIYSSIQIHIYCKFYAKNCSAEVYHGYYVKMALESLKQRIPYNQSVAKSLHIKQFSTDFVNENVIQFHEILRQNLASVCAIELVSQTENK